MVNTTLYIPKKTENFTGYISTIQDSILEHIDVESSSNYSEYYASIKAFEWRNTNPFASKPSYGWISFSFKQNPFFIAYYEIEQRRDADGDFLVKWVFEGSNNNVTWITLDKELSVPGFAAKGERRLFEIKRKGRYQYFRIRSLVYCIMTIKKIDIYGFFCDNEMICKGLYSFLRTKGCQSKRTVSFTYMIIALITNIHS